MLNINFLNFVIAKKTPGVKIECDFKWNIVVLMLLAKVGRQDI